MTRKTVDTEWTDERLDAAYRGLADRAVAPELAGPVMAAIGEPGAPAGSTRFWSWPVRRTTRALGGLAAVLAVVCLIGAALAFRGGGPGAGSGATTAPFKVINVAQAIDAINGGSLTATDLLEVDGWMHGGIGVADCPAQSPAPAVLEATCIGDDLSISDVQASGGNSLIVRSLEFVPPDWLMNAWSKDPKAAIRVKVVGHVDDARASLCGPANRAACARAFVLDQVISEDGSHAETSVILLGVSPKLMPDDAMAKLQPVLGAGSRVVSLRIVSLLSAHQSFWPGLAPSGDGSQVLWYARVIGAPPSSPPMPGAHDGAGVLILDDASGSIRGGAGWGWDPSAAGTKLPNGELTLTTTHWLAGGACAGVGLEAKIHGSATDPRVAWLESSFAGATTQSTVIWPAGYRARFAPNLEILDEHDKVVLREGDAVGGACGSSDSGQMYLEPPFK